MSMYDDTEWVPHPKLVEFTDLIFDPTLDAGMELSRKLDEAFIEADRLQTEAYASGRKDEREEWLPVLEAAKRLIACYSVSHSPAERLSSWSQFRAAIGHIEGKS